MVQLASLGRPFWFSDIFCGVGQRLGIPSRIRPHSMPKRGGGPQPVRAWSSAPFSFLDFVGLFSFASPYRFGPHICFSLGKSTHIDTMGLSGRKEKQRIPNDPRNLSWANSAHLSYLFCTAFTDYISLSPPPFHDDFTLSGYSSKMRPNLVKPISQSWAGTRHKVSASQATGARKLLPSNKSWTCSESECSTRERKEASRGGRTRTLRGY